MYSLPNEVSLNVLIRSQAKRVTSLAAQGEENCLSPLDIQQIENHSRMQDTDRYLVSRAPSRIEERLSQLGDDVRSLTAALYQLVSDKSHRSTPVIVNITSVFRPISRSLSEIGISEHRYQNNLVAEPSANSSQVHHMIGKEKQLVQVQSITHAVLKPGVRRSDDVRELLKTDENRRYDRAADLSCSLMPSDHLLLRIIRTRSATNDIKSGSSSSEIENVRDNDDVESPIMINKMGPKFVLSATEEKVLVDILSLSAKWRCFFTLGQIREIVDEYLDSISRKFAENNKRSRAEVSRTCITDYFQELKSSVQDVPPQNIVNCNESAFVDDPQKKKCVVRRGTRFENIRYFSKISTIVMFAVSGAGDLLLPYVCYKARRSHFFSKHLNSNVIYASKMY
ncbi:hypothetical protein PGB90_001153 [Kerria lacca]